MSKTNIDPEVEVPIEMISKLLTPSEWRMIKQRLRIIQLLDQGRTIRNIVEQVGVGTDTVVRVKKMIEANGIQPQAKNKPDSSISWVFGKGEE